MFTVAIERRPLHCRVLGVAGIGRPPVESGSVSGVTNNELAAFVITGKRDNKRTELQVRARRIDMSLEEAGGGCVDLLIVNSRYVPRSAFEPTFSLYSSAQTPLVGWPFTLGRRT
jgi:hypothetical protein